MKLLKLLFSCLLLSFLSCGNQSEKLENENTTNKEFVSPRIDKPNLLTYFDAQEVIFDTVKNRIEVNIINSKYLQGIKEKIGKKWESPEPWVSVAATYQSHLLNGGIDSLVYYVRMEGHEDRYIYSVKQLQKAYGYVGVCEQFATYLNSENFNAIKSLLSNVILSELNDEQLKDFLKSAFRKMEVDRTELIGTKIIGDKYSFYINFKYADNFVQTYAFSFLEKDNKIAGIEVPK